MDNIDINNIDNGVIDNMLNAISDNDEILSEVGKMLNQDSQTLNQAKAMMKNNRGMIKNMLGQKNTTRKNVKKIGPNEKCPCKSGKKYKKCCYKNTLNKN